MLSLSYSGVHIQRQQAEQLLNSSERLNMGYQASRPGYLQRKAAWLPTLGFVTGTAMSWLAFLWATLIMAGVLAVGCQAGRFADLLLMLL